MIPMHRDVAAVERLPVALKHERLILNRMFLELSMLGRKSLRSGPRLPRDVLVAMAVSLGTLEGRPMSPHKISQMLRLSRPTVARRIDLIHGVRRHQTTYVTTLDAFNVRTPYVREAIRIVMRAAADLAELGHTATQPVAHVEPAEETEQQSPATASQ